MINRLGHVCLGTGNLSEMIAFYTSVCGCSVVHRFINDSNELYGVMLRVADSETFVELFKDDEIIKNGHAAFRHLSFQVDDVVAQAEHLATKGFNTEIKRGRTDGILQFWCADPDGNQVEFTQFDSLSVYSEKHKIT